MEDEPVLEVYDGGGCKCLKWCSVVYLEDLTCLTRLDINVENFECDEVFWRCMGHVDSLRDLRISELHMSYFGGIVELTSCKQLTCLKTACSEEDFPEFEIKVRLLLLFSLN